MQAGRTRIAGRQLGFTMIELMVGLAIGLLLTVVIIQVMTVFEAQNRATTGAADAQTNGAIALYTIGRDMQMAGFSLIPETSTPSPLECSAPAFGTTGVTSISPLSIVNGVASGTVPASDSITIRYGTAPKGGVATEITALPGGNNVTVRSNLGCKVNDIAFIVQGASCNLTTITGPTDIASPPVASSPPNTNTLTLQSMTGTANGARVSCLGAWNNVTYAVNNGNLERNGTPILTGIVNLQMQYGVSATPQTNQVTQWVDATGTWAAPAWNDRNRIKAVRIAVVARSDKRDTAEVTSACSSTVAASPTGLCAWAGNGTSAAPTLDLSTDPDWRHYRYRVFETIFPVRNVIWSKSAFL